MPENLGADDIEDSDHHIGRLFARESATNAKVLSLLNEYSKRCESGSMRAESIIVRHNFSILILALIFLVFYVSTVAVFVFDLNILFDAGSVVVVVFLLFTFMLWILVAQYLNVSKRDLKYSLKRDIAALQLLLKIAIERNESFVRSDRELHDERSFLKRSSALEFYLRINEGQSVLRRAERTSERLDRSIKLLFSFAR